MVRQFIAVTFGLCLSMLFSICSFASTGYPWFQVPNNAVIQYLSFRYYDSSHSAKNVVVTPDSNGVFTISKPSDFVTQSSNYAPRINFYFRGSKSGYYGITFENSNIAFIDSNPGVNNSANIVWANKGYYANSKIYSVQTSYINPSNTVRIGTIAVYHPSGVDGGSSLTASDFPITFKVNAYIGEFNYAGITDNGSYDATEINSNKANTAIDISYSNSESLEEINLRLTSVESSLDNMVSNIISSIEWLTYNITTSISGIEPGYTWNDSQGNSHTYQTYERRTYRIQNQHVVFDSVQKGGTFLGILNQRLLNLLDLIKLQFDIWFEWFYPLKDANPQYWHVYNTDTDSTDIVNPATVTYYITWYLGQLFLMNNDNTPLGNLQDSVDDIKDQLVNVENQEQSIITSIRTGIDNFAPDLTQIGSFKALSWCSNYLQQIYVALGSYGTVILIGLLLGVCMQFIGYFRYK